MQRRIPAVLMRGGTSKGLFFKVEDLPEDLKLQDQVILAAYGSPDPYGRQINGLGGATSVTSKVAIVGPRPGEKNAVNYTFGQVGITQPLVDRKGNCGNISSAVGPFAIDEGLVEEVEEPVTTVNIFNTNTGKYIIARVPVENGRAKVEGDYAIAGVPGTGAKICLDFMNPGGAVTGKLLPTGHAQDTLETPYGHFNVSIVDAANPLVFVRASDLGLSGTELPAQVDGSPDLLARIEAIRAAAAVKIGLVATPEEATAKSPAVPKIAWVAPPRDYTMTSGLTMKASDIDLLARTMSMGRLHAAYAITGAICTAGAAKIPGTVVEEALSPAARAAPVVRIGHPGGDLAIEVEMRVEAGHLEYVRGTAFRTARRLMEGWVLVPEECWNKKR